MINEKLDRESMCWSLSDGLSNTYLYPEDVDRIVDGLKILKTRYTTAAVDFNQCGMVNCRNHIRNVIGDINSLIELLGGNADDNTLSDIAIQN